MRFYLTFTIFIFLTLIKISAQPPRLESIKKQVNSYNDSLKYEKSIKLLYEFITSTKTTNLEKSYAYIYKAHTYKYLLNYAKTLYYLDLALEEGIKSKEKDKLIQIIKAEKALVYFDIREISKADTLMKEIAATQYKDIPENIKVWLFTQEGYILMNEKKFDLAANRIDEAIKLSSKNSPEHLPVIYGKKLTLLNEMGEYDKRDSMFDVALDMAISSNQIKYQIYLYQTMHQIYEKNKDYYKAYITYRIFDSLNHHQFKPHFRSSSLDLLEKKLEEKKKKNSLKKGNLLILLLLLVIVGLLFQTYFLSRLYKTYKLERDLIEKENQLISSEVKSLTKKLEENKNEALDLSQFNLTERQIQIIELIRQGKTNKEIAETLFISENTVKYHIKSIFKILNIKNRLEIK